MARQGERPAWARWGLLLASAVGVWLFMFVVAPGVRRVPVVGEALDVVRELEIDASALFYTEIESFSRAELMIRESMSTQRNVLTDDS